jgi:iron(III) transport system ATP-binding protein
MSGWLSVTGLSKSFGTTPVLRDVGLRIEPGALIAILGASGGGKTTLLRLIAGFERPDAGEISLDGVILAGPGTCRPPQRRGIGYVAQEGALFPHLSVAENIGFGLPRTARRRHQGIADLLALVGLPAAYAARAPHSLSGGEQQRVALARALAPGPKLILLDEPFSALDAGLRAETRQAVAAALAAAGATAILVTHDQAEALSMGSLIGVLQQGALSALCPPASLYRRPASAALADFIGEALFLPATVRGGIAHCVLGDLAVDGTAADGPAELMLRPEQIRLDGALNDTSGIGAQVETVAFYGHDAMVRLRLTGATGPTPTVSARVFSQSAPQAGDRVCLHVEGPVVAFAPRSPQTTSHA